MLTLQVTLIETNYLLVVKVYKTTSVENQAQTHFKQSTDNQTKDNSDK